MPYYDYLCADCSHTFEAFQSMSDPSLKTCPECKADDLRRLIGGGTGIIFKGSGFYVNDSKVSSTSPKQKPSDTKAAPDKKQPISTS